MKDLTKLLSKTWQNCFIKILRQTRLIFSKKITAPIRSQMSAYSAYRSPFGFS